MNSALIYYIAVIILLKTATSFPVNSDSAAIGNVQNGYRMVNEWLSNDANRNNYARENLDLLRRDRKSFDDYEGGVKGGVKRGLDIGVNLKLRTTPKSDSDGQTKAVDEKIYKLEETLEKLLEGKLEAVLDSTSCSKCDEEEEEALPGSPVKSRLKPAYKCDDWDAKKRLCVLERNIGDTVTFYLSTGNSNGHRKNVTWKKEFHMRDSNIRTEYILDPGNSPENIIIGKQGYELRVNPITEIDIDYNSFSATLEGHSSARGKLNFVIRIVPIDLGFVYVGETIELNLRSYVSLPSESLIFSWYIEQYGEHGTLPSNIRTSSTGSSIKISELRQEQEGILACSVFTNLNFLATKKRFLIKDLFKNKDVLQSAPNHNLTFTEVLPDKKKRVPKKNMPSGLVNSKRIKKYVDALDFVDEALVKSTTEAHLAAGMGDHDVTPTHSFTDYELDMGSDNKRSPKPFEDFREAPKDFGNPYQNEANLERLNQYDGSPDTNPLGVAERSKSGLYRSQEQNSNERFIPQMQSYALSSQYKRKPSSHFPDYEEPLLENAFSRKQDIDGKQMNLAYPPPKPLDAVGNDRKYGGDIYAETKKDYETQRKESDIILNIEKVPGPRRVSAEESISKLISSCYTDFECSGMATCVRNSLKLKGYCKCLPGFYGVGIFCRENIWMSNGNFDVEVHDQDGYLNIAG